MAQSNKHITPDNITEWLASTGFLFPRNELELLRVEKLYVDQVEHFSGNEVDPEKIINGNVSPGIIKLPESLPENHFEVYKMVARNGSKIPKHILDKMKENQEKRKKDDTNTKEGESK